MHELTFVNVLAYFAVVLKKKKKEKEPSMILLCLLRMALTLLGVERFTKVTVQHIPRH